jgi:DNA topoisomerase I
MAQRHASKRLPDAWRALVRNEAHAKRAKREIRRRVASAPDVAPNTSAEVAGLRYVNDTRMPGFRRIGRDKRVRYVDPNGRTVSDRDVLQRIKTLAIPPAWRDVWICPHPLGHLQATGRDARGRKQYRYHPKWREIRDEVKYGRLIAFSAALPKIRKRTTVDLARTGLPREKVLAAVVQLLEKTLIRVGNEEYARDNHSFGLTTMHDGHAKINGTSVRFEFRGKSGIAHSVDLRDTRLARIVKACRDLPGYELFQYVDGDGERHVVDSADVNQYLREVSGGEPFTAKDFRTWAGTVLVARALAAMRPGAAGAAKGTAKRNVVRAIESVAKRLGNTQTVCRKCYIHPAILDAYMDGDTIATLQARTARLRRAGALTPEESAVVTLIEKRLA